VGKKANRNEQLVRVLQLLSDLGQRSGCDIYSLAERYGTSTRTIRRDLEALAGVGIPLKQQAGDGSRLLWSIDLETPRARQLVAVANAALTVRSGDGEAD
jgi:predicted DNA-binding transcriptional regulator YafY